MKTYKLFFITVIIFISGALSQIQSKNMEKSKSHSCHNVENFDKVYSYLKKEITEGNTHFYIHKGYEFYLIDNQRIDLRKSNYTLAVIDKDKGIYALAKNKSDNNRNKRKADKLFCELLEKMIN